MNTNGNEIVKIGTKVMWRGGWGHDAPKEATIKYIELCESENCKYGDPVSEVSVEDLHRCCVGLDNGHWAYGDQITEIIG